jgi:hypothetical protein
MTLRDQLVGQNQRRPSTRSSNQRLHTRCRPVSAFPALGVSDERQPRPELSSRALPAWNSVLAVVAHPDDESFGLGAIIDASNQAATRTAVLCLTGQ